MRTARRAFALLGPLSLAAMLLAVAWLGRRDRVRAVVEREHLKTSAHELAVERFRSGLVYERKGDGAKAHDEFQLASAIDPSIWREAGPDVGEGGRR